jgi:SOS-response transcriptional repressor LexA
MSTRERILAYLRYVDHSPSIREIGKAVGLRSPATVHAALNQMEREGLIERHGPDKRISVRAA